MSPGPETAANPWVYPYQYPIHFGNWGGAYEVDLNDNYGRWSQGAPMGHQVDYLTPNIYGVPWTTPPYTAYLGNTGGLTAFPNAGPPFVAAASDLTVGFHDIVMSWNAAKNMIYEFLDGKLLAKSFLDYSFSPWYVDSADGVRKQVAMHLIIGNQAIPRFAPSFQNAVNNDGNPSGWTIFVQEISVWNGIVTRAVN